MFRPDPPPLQAERSIAWNDVFSLVQIAMLVLGVLETVVVHSVTRMERAKLTDAALAADSVMRLSLPSYYLFAVTWLVVWGSTRGSNPQMLITLGIVFVVVAVVPTAFQIKWQYGRRASFRRNALKALSEEPKSNERLQLVFDAFDRDGSGTLSLNELRHLLKAILPSETRKRRNEFIAQVRQSTSGAKDSLKFEEVAQHVAAWSEVGDVANDRLHVHVEQLEQELEGAVTYAKDRTIKAASKFKRIPGAAHKMRRHSM